MKRITKVLIGIVPVFTLLITSAVASIAWFESNKNQVEMDITGSVVEEYFHCGAGTESNPYVITRPVHYYHMVEFFQRLTVLPNVNTESSSFGVEYLYFQIGYDFEKNGTYQVYDYSDTGVYLGTEQSDAYSSSLNMAYYSNENALMPIGTSEIPFFGAVDGKGLTIANLSIVCAETFKIDGTTYNRTTSDAGIFGYVKNYVDPQNPSNNKETDIHDIYFSGVDIDLTGARPSSTGSGHGATTISSSTYDHTTGEDAHANVGYVIGHLVNYTNWTNAPSLASPLHDVYVNNCRVRGGPGSHSSYGFIGQVDNIDGSMMAQEDIDEQIGALYTASGDGAGWGGSISMNHLFDRISVFRDEVHTTYDGQHVNGVANAGQAMLQPGNSDFTGDNHILSGGPDFRIGTSQSKLRNHSFTIDESATEKAFYIKCGDRYLNLDSRAKLTTAETVKKNQWRISDEGYLFTVMTATWEVARNNNLTRNNVVRFLLVDTTGTNVYAGTYPDGSSTFERKTENGQSVIYRKNTTRKLTLDANTNKWLLMQSAGTDFLCKIHYGDHYAGVATFAHNQNLIGVSSENALIWTVTYINKNYKRFRFTASQDGASLYLNKNSYGPYNARVQDSSGYIYLNTGNNTSRQLTPASGQYIEINDANRHIYYSGNQFLTSTSSDTYGTKRAVIEEYVVTIIDSIALEETDVYKLNIGALDSEVADSETYLPLNVEQGSIGGSLGNVGYICSGSNSTASTATVGDIRIQRQAYNLLSGSVSGPNNPVTIYTNKLGTGNVTNQRYSFSDTLTKSDSAIDVSSYNFTRYHNYALNEENKIGARNQMFETLFDDTTYIYGVRFLNASVSKDNYMTATNVNINGVHYDTYQLPRDCIDFSLEDEGKICFFAGTFSSVGFDAQNNCFFSLHEVTRYKEGDEIPNGKAINDIKNITEIRYIYENDSTSEILYSNTTKGNGYTLLFDTEWLTDPANLALSSLYYFEIPVRAGEYALGSVSGVNKNGSCLCYLDIAAAGDKEITYDDVNRISVHHYFSQMDYATRPFSTINTPLTIAYVVPDNSDKNKFVISVRRGTRAETISGVAKTFTCYYIEVVNLSGSTFELSVLLSDDDNDRTNEYLYEYAISYNGGASQYYMYSSKFRADGTAQTTSMTDLYPPKT